VLKTNYSSPHLTFSNETLIHQANIVRTTGSRAEEIDQG